MVRITVDDEIMAKLHNLNVPLELCDEKGYVRGKLTPVGNQDDPDETSPTDASDQPNAQ